jgi:hypothetical protein
MQPGFDSAVFKESKGSGEHVVRVKCGGTRIDVRGNTEAPIRWLPEFFEIADGELPLVHVVDLTIDAHVYASMCLDLRANVSTPADCFTRDGRFERHGVVQRGDGIRTIIDERARLFCQMDARCAKVAVVAESDHRHARATLMRIIRELATVRGHERGDLLLHAGGAVHDGRAVLFVGSKGAGKTSMLLNAVGRGEADFLSNDRVVLEVEESGTFATGQPTIVRTRPESLRFLESPCESDWDRSFSYGLTAEEAVQSGPVSVVESRTCFSMSPTQFCRWMNVERSGRTSVSGIVFPRIDPSVESFELAALDSETTTMRLVENLLATAAPAVFANENGESAPNGDAVWARCAQVAKTVPGIDCILGPNAYHSPNVWQGLKNEYFNGR